MLPKGLKNSLNKIRQISSDIYHQYIPILEDDTDISVLAQPVLTVPEVYNEFCNALVNRIVYTQIVTKTFNNPLRGLEGNVMPLGYAGQEIYVNPAKGRQYNPDDFAGILQKYEADVKVQYLIKNMDIQYPLTVIRTKLKEAFVSWENLDTFITGLTNSLYNGMYIDEFKWTKALVSSAYKNNMVQVEQVSSPLTSESLAKTFVTKARELYLNFQMPTTKYNAWAKVGGAGKPITTWTEASDIVILVRNDVRAYMDVNVLADAFQIDKTVLLGNMYAVDSFDVYDDEGTKIFDGSNIFGMIADRNWFKIKPVDQFMENGYNANNRAMQYFLNNIKMYEFSLFANGVVFATTTSTVHTESLQFEEATKTIKTNASNPTVKVQTTPYGATDSVSYSSSDSSVATVSANSSDSKICEITIAGAGSTTINATSNSKTATMTLIVENVAVESMHFEHSSSSVTSTKDEALVITPLDADAPITYVSTDTSVATVAPKDATYGTCTITKVAAGSCQIIATSGSQVATLPVTVS